MVAVANSTVSLGIGLIATVSSIHRLGLTFAAFGGIIASIGFFIAHGPGDMKESILRSHGGRDKVAYYLRWPALLLFIVGVVLLFV